MPGNVERLFGDLRAELFRVTGAISTQALPPLLPLAYIPAIPAPETFPPLPQEQTPPLKLGAREPAGDTLVSAVRFPEVWRSWLSSLPQSEAPDGLPVPLAGVFLGARDALAALDARLPDDAPVPGLPGQLTVMHLQVIRVLPEVGREWWLSVDWEAVWSKRIKLRG